MSWSERSVFNAPDWSMIQDFQFLHCHYYSAHPLCSLQCFIDPCQVEKKQIRQTANPAPGSMCCVPATWPAGAVGCMPRHSPLLPSVDCTSTFGYILTYDKITFTLLMWKGAGRKISPFAIFRYSISCYKWVDPRGILFWSLKTVIFVSHRKMVGSSQVQLNSLSTNVLFSPTPTNNRTINGNDSIYWDFIIFSCIVKRTISISLLNETIKDL